MLAANTWMTFQTFVHVYAGKDVEGAVSQGIGWAHDERIVLDDSGKIVNPKMRNYRIPAYADIPRC